MGGYLWRPYDQDKEMENGRENVRKLEDQTRLSKRGSRKREPKTPGTELPEATWESPEVLGALAKLLGSTVSSISPKCFYFGNPFFLFSFQRDFFLIIYFSWYCFYFMDVLSFHTSLTVY